MKPETQKLAFILRAYLGSGIGQKVATTATAATHGLAMMVGATGATQVTVEKDKAGTMAIIRLAVIPGQFTADTDMGRWAMPRCAGTDRLAMRAGLMAGFTVLLS